MAPRDRSPSKPFRRLNSTVLNYKARRNLSRLLRVLYYTVFVTILTVISFKLMRTYAPHVEAPHFDFFHLTFRSTNKKIDWHDYEKIQKELLRQGPGEQGKPGNYSHLQQDLIDEMYKLNGYNGALSDIISVDRSLPDIRHPDCKKKLYRSVLPTASIIIPFHNEHPSTLIRTARSVINRAPEHLIKEIIYVDDFSSREPLKEEFEKYLAAEIPKASIVRLPERKGLINARTAGAKVAKGDVLIFLDAHCEATVNWLPPLLDPIAADYKTCMCPFIDVIDYDTYEYRAQDEGGRGVFDWNLLYKRLPRLKEDKKRPAEPFASPVMAGGLFAISARFFWELGGYDEGLDIWGGEQYELSFKIWQCGGRMLDAPCSRIGHVYRKFGPFPNPRKGKDFVCVNFKRVAEVWMDEYKKYYYMRHPDCEKQDEGDISSQLAIRERLKCKPFKWFMEEIAFDLPKRYPMIEPPDVANGFIRSIGHPDLCIEIQGDSVEMRKCAADYWAQIFQHSWKGDIRHKNAEKCWDVSEHQIERSPIKFYPCHGAGGNQLWKYKEETKNILMFARCLDMDPTTNQIFVSKCNPNSNTQQWEFEHIDTKENEKLDKYVISLISGLIKYENEE